MAYFNMLRTVFSAGMLGMPLALSQLGIVLGPIVIMSTGLLITHMHHTLVSKGFTLYMYTTHALSPQVLRPLVYVRFLHRTTNRFFYRMRGGV
jgi:hypothetical protein